MITIQRLDLDDARIMLDAAKVKAVEVAVPMCIAITDDAGNLIAFERMDGGKVTSTTIAIDKSYTASGAKKATHEYGDASQPGKPACDWADRAARDARRGRPAGRGRRPLRGRNRGEFRLSGARYGSCAGRGGCALLLALILELDHAAVVAPSLAQGSGYVRDKARSAMAWGGEQLAPFCEDPRHTFRQRAGRAERGTHERWADLPFVNRLEQSRNSGFRSALDEKRGAGRTAPQSLRG